MRDYRLGLFLLGALPLAALTACPSSGWDDLCQGAQCGVDGGGDGPAPDTVVYVNGAAAAGGDGTKEKPFQKIGDALGKGAKIDVCGAGPYIENVVIGASVQLAGGFDCATWTAATGVATTVSPASGIALKITAGSVTVSDMTFTAKDGQNPGESSIAGFVANATSVTFHRVTLAAGKGVAGKGPVPPTEYSGRAPDGIGATATAAGGTQPNNACPAPLAKSVGAAGGGTGADGGTGEPPLAQDPPGNNGAGGNTNGANCGLGGGSGQDGAFGPGGNFGASATVLGHLSADRWMPADGVSGENGGTAQGGGGGAGKGGFGGGGGAGGCGGLGGAGGQGGGSSIALAVFQTPVTLDACALHAIDAGAGGSGGTGQKGQLGSNANGGGLAGGCGGGYGGHGGSGGGGGGGAGGSSIALAYQGPAPTVDGAAVSDISTPANFTVQTVNDNGGAPGAGGAAAQTTSPASHEGKTGTAKGVSGVSKPVAVLP